MSETSGASRPAPPPAPVAVDRYPGNHELNQIALHLDVAYYCATYPDVARPDIDPVAHFAEHGWRERRNPSPWFDTAFYLTQYPDIRAAGINPLLHYVTAGAAEGRQPRPPGGLRRVIAERATPPDRRPAGYDAPADAVRLNATDLLARLTTLCTGAVGLALSVSHDRSIDVTGGIQIFLADEMALFEARGVAYLHVSPAIARLTIDTTTTPDPLLQIVMAGVFQGLATTQDLRAAFFMAAPMLSDLRQRPFIVHSLFGHRPADIVALAASLQPTRRYFWLHDYATVCEGFNLLRNDWAFCHGPPSTSTACRICVYGSNRQHYRAAMQRLFAALDFDVLAPSQYALGLWSRAAGLVHRSARVHENCQLVQRPVTRASDMFEPGDGASRPDDPALPEDRPVRVAFVGYPLPHKGWHLFLDLLHATRPMGRYAFYHFAIPSAALPHDGLTFVATQVDRQDRMAMVTALAAHAIDLVAVLSPWPETFSYVAHEAMAAGADVVALADSGNVADAVRRYGRGVVLADEAALTGFFTGPGAWDYVVEQRAAGPRRGVLQLTGTTATLADDLAEPAAAWRERS